MGLLLFVYVFFPRFRSAVICINVTHVNCNAFLERSDGPENAISITTFLHLKAPPNTPPKKKKTHMSAEFTSRAW